MTADSATYSAIATSRFGFGARPGERATVAADPRGWLLAQLRVPDRTPAELDGLASSREILATFLAARAQQAAERADLKRQTARGEDPVKQLAAGVREQLQPHYIAQAAARTRIALLSESTFRERLVHFWSNHFAVSVDKPICLGTAGALENEVIRPRIAGTFADLLLAVETHPAMITYLDNQQSVGPHSQAAQYAARRAWRGRGPAKPRIGLNENLAREILELHTLGVDGGYTQADVTTFAAVITGWSIGGGNGRFAAGEPGAFTFREAIHEPGSKTLLGRRYAEGGLQQGQAVLRDLAAHPATARHLAAKLARHFVADDPPPGLVERLAGAYQSSDGHLPAVYAALVTWDGAWEPEPRKFKTPQDFAYSALRALDVAPREPKKLLSAFEVLGQRHWAPGSPAGWPDRQQDWDGADALMKRIEWSVALADRVGNSRSALDTAETSLGPLAGTRTRSALTRAASGSQALTLLLMSPEFQRR
ncbi:MAG TPA: DUF1800 domain-containing protein [Steroidobacteraceae bacterium]|nr:DUF1800 domain-containing protein [Steroidobacteraceae bacterium]